MSSPCIPLSSCFALSSPCIPLSSCFALSSPCIPLSSICFSVDDEDISEHSLSPQTMDLVAVPYFCVEVPFALVASAVGKTSIDVTRVTVKSSTILNNIANCLFM
ncbi:hypothetical protein DSQ20_06035 [Nitrosarchaeum sp. AC2]|nr:hypothetical protein DSQ20_06035 [Nitrosarchaeum sp. AC2]